MQQSMFTTDARLPDIPESIDFRNCDVMLLIQEMVEKGIKFRLVMADPPWDYTNTGSVGKGFNGAAKAHYGGLKPSEIVAFLDAAYDIAEDDSYLFMWFTFPLMYEFFEAERVFNGGAGMRWKYKTGGAWIKGWVPKLDITWVERLTRVIVNAGVNLPVGPDISSWLLELADGLRVGNWKRSGAFGSGFHMRGDCEPFALYVKGNPKPVKRILSNAYGSCRDDHSEKPVKYLEQVIDALTNPDDGVFSLFSGLAPELRAAKALKRRAAGAELLENRFRKALQRLASYGG